MIGPDDQAACAGLLAAAILGRDNSAFLEVRGIKHGTRATQVWLPASEVHDRLPGLRQAATDRDLYMGALPRTRHAGGADAVDRSWVLWVDADGQDAVDRLADFTPRPNIIITTGSGPNVHAWWSLREPLAAAHTERACRRLAHHLGGDIKSTDRARVLRVPGTLNHKHAPPVAVTCTRMDVGRGYTARDIVGDLADPPHQLLDRRAARQPRDVTGDVLLAISPLDYVPALTGRPVGRDHKIRCPFHGGGEERTPSLHVYPDPERGWTCFGCGKGGSIIDLGALVYGIEPRGHGFHEIRKRIARDLLAVAA
jgi:hypothetical protein